MVRWLVVPTLVLIFGLPVLLVALPAILWPVLPVWVATLLLGPLAYAALFVTTAGVLSLPFQKAIIPGKFPRDLSHPIYGRRRLYGLCWTSVYYHKPVYYLCLTIPLLKRLTFRLFGYRGSMDFTLYPDTWIRDLPLLDFGPGAYVSNRATLGTNMALSNGKVLVDKIRLGKGALFGHLTVVGPGLVMGDGSEIGAASVLGSRIEIGEGSFVGQFSGVNHHVKIGAHAVIGGHSLIEIRAVIGPDLELPAGTCVPSRSKIMTKSDVDALLSTQNSSLPRLRQELSRFEPGIETSHHTPGEPSGRRGGAEGRSPSAERSENDGGPQRQDPAARTEMEGSSRIETMPDTDRQPERGLKMLDLHITLDGGPLEPADLFMWASTANDPSVRLTVEFAPDARTRVSECTAFVDRLLADGGLVYGLNTGFGHFAERPVPADRLEDLQINLIRSHACAVGDDLPRDIVQAMWILRLNTLCQGRSGIRLETMDRIARLLREGVLSCVPSRGSVGASGDLAPNAHAVLPLLGEGECTRPNVARDSFERVSGTDALSGIGMEPVHLAPREGLALVNGTQLTTALAVKAWARALHLWVTANVATALTMEAVGGAFSILEDLVLATHHPGTQVAGRQMAGWLEGSTHLHGAAKDERFIQAPYCLRCAPQVHGAVWEELERGREVLREESRVISDNPLLFPERNEVYSCGNFHAIYPARVSDALASAMATLGSISERRVNLMMDEKLSGMPRFLVADGGLNSGMMMLQVTAAALVSECRSLSLPASVDSIPTNCDREDHVSMGPIAGFKAIQIAEHLERIIAIELLAGAQALDLRNHVPLTCRIKRIQRRIRARVPFLVEDRVLAPDIAAMVEMIRRGEVTCHAAD